MRIDVKSQIEAISAPRYFKAMNNLQLSTIFQFADNKGTPEKIACDNEGQVRNLPCFFSSFVLFFFSSFCSRVSLAVT
jgi:hypothetical protein